MKSYLKAAAWRFMPFGIVLLTFAIGFPIALAVFKAHGVGQ